MVDVSAYFERLTSDFAFFCSHITTQMREWHKMPRQAEFYMGQLKISKHQREYIEYLESDLINKVVLKPRQKGFSVITLAYCLWKTMYHKNQNILYFIDTQKKAGDFLLKIETMMQNMPAFMKPTKIWVQKSGKIKINNNYLYIQTVAGGNGARSGTYSMVICDELAHYKKSSQDSLMSSLASACFNRVFISTPKCEHDIYHTMVAEAETEGRLYKHNFFDDIEDWFGTQEIAQAWYDAQAKDLSSTDVIRELDCEFAGALEDRAWVVDPEFFTYFTPKTNEYSILGMDVGWIDSTAVLFAAERNGTLIIYDELLVDHMTIPSLVPLIRNKTTHIRYLAIDSNSKKVDQTSGISIYRQLRQQLARPIYTSKIPDQLEMLRIANTALLEGRVKIDSRCTNLIAALNNMQVKEGKLVRSKYKHSHDAFVYLILNWIYRSKKRRTGVRVRNTGNLGAFI